MALQIELRRNVARDAEQRNGVSLSQVDLEHAYRLVNCALPLEGSNESYHTLT